MHIKIATNYDTCRFLQCVVKCVDEEWIVRIGTKYVGNCNFLVVDGCSDYDVLSFWVSYCGMVDYLLEYRHLFVYCCSG